jgi:hypothetical protein
MIWFIVGALLGLIPWSIRLPRLRFIPTVGEVLFGYVWGIVLGTMVLGTPLWVLATFVF